MKLNFKIDTTGYIVFEALKEDSIIRIGHSSSYGDKFQELLNQFWFIYEQIKNNNAQYFPYSFEILWNDDFVNYKWSVNISSAKSLLNIKIFELSTSDTEYKVKLLDESLEFEVFFNQLFISLDKMFNDFGMIGYKIVWEAGNFPIFEYLTLKAERNGIELKKISDSEDNEWKQKTSLADELYILNI